MSHPRIRRARTRRQPANVVRICVNLSCQRFAVDQSTALGNVACPACQRPMVDSEWRQPGCYTSALAQALDTVGEEFADEETGSMTEGSGHHLLYRVHVSGVRAIMTTDSQGFVHATGYDTEAELVAAWTELTDETANADADADITDQLNLPVGSGDSADNADTHIVITCSEDHNEPVALVELLPGQPADAAFGWWCLLEADAICRGEKVDEGNTRERREVLEGVTGSHNYHALRSVKLPLLPLPR